jgi:transaldolase
MKIFIDSSIVEEIEQAYSYGILDGVTTNPSLIKKAVQSSKGKIDMAQYITKILKVARGTPVSLEVIGTTYKDIIKEGLGLYKRFNKVAKNVVVKVPVNPAFSEDDGTQFDGIKAIKTLSSKRIPINCTLIFTPEQALLAAKAGATYVSPFAGRIDDLLRSNKKLKFDKTAYYPEEGKKGMEDNGIVSGIDLVAQCVEILRYYELKTEVLAASLRNPQQVREAALVGSDIATIPASVIEKLLMHPKTYEGMTNFTKDIVPEYQKLINKIK